MDSDIRRFAEALERAGRILFVTGAGLSAASGLPTYRGLGGLYNGHTEEGLPIERVLSEPMLRQRPELCWKYLAELGRACLAAQPNRAHLAIAELQRRKPGCWLLTQNIDGLHSAAGSPEAQTIEIHGRLSPLFCMQCGREDPQLVEHLQRPLPPRCGACEGVLRPPVVLFEEMLPGAALETLWQQMAQGFEVVVAVGTTASFGYIAEPFRQARQRGALTVEINPEPTVLSGFMGLRLNGAALDIFDAALGHTLIDRICKSES